MSVTRILRDAARDQALHDEQWAGDRCRSAARVDAALGRRRRAPDDGRRADVRAVDDMDGAGVEHRRARARPSGATPSELVRAPAAPLRAGRRCCTSARASGIPASRCRAGRSLYWRTDGEPIWREPALHRARDRRHAARDAEASAFIAALVPSGWPRPRDSVIPAYEDVWLLPAGASSSCRSTSTRRRRSSTDQVERARLARVFEQGLERRSATCCRSSARHADAARRWADGARGSCAADSCS